MTDSILAALLDQLVTVTKLTRDYSGNRTASATTANVPCAVQQVSRRVTNREGRQVTANAVAFFGPDAPFDTENADYQVAYGNSTFEVVAIEPVRNHETAEVHHYEVALL